MFAIALSTPWPRKRFASPSRNSNASCRPVEAPEGTIAWPRTPPSASISAITVGFPRESNTSKAVIFSILGIERRQPRQRAILQQRNHGAAANRHVVKAFPELEPLENIDGISATNHSKAWQRGQPNSETTCAAPIRFFFHFT